ncbi:TaqI-like C-terminal specificity domain-containing protein [Dolichospermum circinale]|uniref:TaqI-like C-terminal specificity domain-containing protein n=1 Tax=Dolichospermum circinale TaxID=109265 RepID=UPI0018C9BEA6|nr:TaqI-like C-terminal specificity domain-containing protein [Dolichospermum circinale]MDB9474871.1 TaqI-like C-terminal specificity domain-containing protein [Dolichospermum circinale CS-537/11]MDB9478576.1 TaqI-like C-terminal specificity domain-containing protein [Dolichospermum circinale CS-537/03]
MDRPKLQYISNTVISKDIYLFFIELSLDIIFQIGTIGLITPNTWMTLESGCDFRKLVLQTTQLIKIAEFRSAFQDAIVETAALIASKDVNSCKNTEVLNFANQEIITRYFRLTSEWLLNEGYVIDYYLNMEEISILNKSINQCIKLEELVNICGGTKLYQKGKGNPPQTQLVVKEKPYTSNKLLPDFEPLITGGDIQKYVTQNELIYVKYGVWLAEPRNESIFRNQKIIVRRTDDSIIASIDCDLRICQNSVHCLLKKQDSIFSDYFLLSILNSFYIKWWYQKKNFQMVGKPFAEVKVIYLSRIPVPKISFTTPAEKRQTYLENTINLYQQYQINHNPNILLTQIDHHLNQQPEEADVIHDLLVYLAEQMIELNKQKQTEIKSFLTWLARLIGTDIDNLTNKSKIQNYLGDYYKQKQADNHLTLDELIDILKKNKKKLKIDISGRKEQETLAKEYQASLNTLLPIKKQLKQCDWLIDEIVYKLYKLTPEEKAIIEGENN